MIDTREDSLTPLVRTSAPLCGPGLLGGLTTRRGFPAGDDNDAERGRGELRVSLAAALQHPAEAFAWCKQVHGARVMVAHEAGLLGEADALVTTQASLGLLVAVADCGPVLIWDPNSTAIAAAHAGWRGLLAGVLENTVEALVELGATGSTLRAWIGPCISVEHFEVGEEVATQFATEFALRKPDWKRPHVDLKAAARSRLIDAGLSAGHIAESEDCTYALPQLYHSYRRDQGICGRHLAYLLRR